MVSCLYDLRSAIRQIRTAPAFALTVILILALGIGANTSVFTLVHAVLLKSLPVAKPEQLFRLGDRERCCVNGGLEGSWSLFPYTIYKQMRDNNSAFKELAAFEAQPETVALRRINSNHPAESRGSEFVSGNYFRMFGISSYEGRLFTAEDDHPARPPVAVISYRTWQEKYGSDPSLIGSAIAINGQPFTLIGVAPPGFFGDGLRSNPPDIWIPLSFEPQVHGPNSILSGEDEWLNLIGRLPSSANPKKVEAQLTTELRQWLLQSQGGWSDEDRRQIPQQLIRLTPGGAGVQTMRDNYGDGLKLLLWVTGFVLLIACANLANLLLARATARRQETCIRTAIGASRARLFRQTFTETLLLAVLGGSAGLLVAVGGTRSILRLAFPDQYVPIDPTPAWPVLGLVLAVAVITGLFFALAPVWFISQAQPVDALRSASRATAARNHWIQRALVIFQVALSLVLICAAGSVTNSLIELRQQHFGFDTDGRYILQFDPQMAGYKVQQLDTLYHQIRDGLQHIPGVKEVTYAQYTPMSGNNWEGQVNIEGRSTDGDSSVFVRVGPDYFSTIGTRILQGRAITEQDTQTTRPVALVNEEFVKRYFQGQNAIGRHIGQGGTKHAGDLEVVGVTENTNYWSPGETIRPMFFHAVSQEIKRSTPDETLGEESSMYLGSIILRTSAPVPNLEKQVRDIMGQINPDLPLNEFLPFAQQVHGHLDQQQMIAQLMTIFGLLALTLAAVGLYGVTSYGVERRINEIGVRVALGADRQSVISMVLRAVGLQVAAGFAIGVPLTLVVGRLLAAQFFGVRTFDLKVFAVGSFALLTSASIAGMIPARRAASVDPIQALRAE